MSSLSGVVFCVEVVFQSVEVMSICWKLVVNHFQPYKIALFLLIALRFPSAMLLVSWLYIEL